MVLSVVGAVPDRGTVVSPFAKRLSVNPACSHSHQLIEDGKFQPKLQGIAEHLHRMTRSRQIQIDHYRCEYIEKDGSDVDIDQVEKNAPLSHRRLVFEQSPQGVEIDTRHGTFGQGVTNLSEAFDNCIGG